MARRRWIQRPGKGGGLQVVVGPMADSIADEIRLAMPALGRIASKLAPTKSKVVHTRLASHHSSGRALARLQLLILIHPPHREAEWRCSSGEWRAAPFDAVEHAACRSSRSRPEGNAPGWIPERRNAEPKRGAGRSGRAFFCLLFLGVCKKSESP